MPACRRGSFTNRYLAECLVEEAGCPATVTGEDRPLPAICPCCGAASLDERGVNEICIVCWLGDDGQDDPDADRVLGGPNGALSLTQARINILRHGIHDPARTDLRTEQVPRHAFHEGRLFQLTEDGSACSKCAFQSERVGCQSPYIMRQSTMFHEAGGPCRTARRLFRNA